MDDAGTEHADGWVLVDGRRGRRGRRRATEPDADETVDLGRRRRHPRPRQHAPPPLPDPHARAGAGGRPLHAGSASCIPSWARIDAEAEYAAARTGLAELALSGLHDRLRPPLRLPARPRTGSDRGGGAGGARARRAHRRLARLDGPRRVGRRPAARRARRGRSTRCSRTPSGSSARCHEPGPGARVQIAVAPCSPFSVTGRLMEESAALARRLGLRLHTHLAETVEEEAYCRELYGCTPGRVPRPARLARRRRLVRPLRPPLAGEIARLRGDRDGRRALPDLEPAPRRGRRARCASCVDAGVRVGLGVDGSASNERGDLFLEVKQALLVARGRGGGDGDDRARGAAARHPRRRGGARPRRHRLARAGQAAPTSRSGATDGLELGGAEDLVAGLVLRGPASRRPARRRRRGRRARRGPRRRRRGRDRARAPPREREGSPHERLTLDPRARHRRGRACRRRRVELCRGDELRRRRADRRRRPRADLADELEPARTASSSTRRRRSSRGSSSGRARRAATTTSRSSSRPYGCASYRGS